MHPLDTAPFAVRFIAGLSAAIFVWLVVAEIGHALVRPYVGKRSVAAALGAALGYALLGSAIALLGVAHAIKPSIVIGIVVAAALVRVPAYARIIARRYELASAAREWARSLSPLGSFALGVNVFAVVTAAISAALPAVWWDPLAYHLPIASRALATGAFGINLGMVQSAWPSLGEAAALPAYAAAGTAGAAMSMLFAGIVLALICALLAERYAAGSGPLASALVTSCALWLWLAPSSYVDVQFALFAVAAIATPLLAADSSAVAAGALSGLFVGAAAATKYAGLPLGAVAVVILFAAGPRQRGRALAAFVTGAIVIGAGWYLRDLVTTGDPLYPFLTAIRAAKVSIAQFPGLNSKWEQHWCGFGNGASDLIALPWRLLTDPRSFCGDLGYALRLGLIFAIVSLARIRTTWPIVLAAFGITLYWFVLAQELRFLLPALALFAVLVAIGTETLRPRLARIADAVLLMLCAYGVLANWLPWTIADASSSLVPGYAYMVGTEDGPGYLRRRLETYGAAEWLAQHGIARDQVISADDIRTYYFWGGIAWANPAYEYVWKLDWSLPAGKRYGALKQAGFRYLFVNATPAYVHRTPTGVDWNVLAADVGQGALAEAYRDGDVAIYQMR